MADQQQHIPQATTDHQNQLQVQQQLQAQQTHIIQAFWQNQLLNIEQTQTEFKSHSLPIARIKKVMKSDDDVKTLMISAELTLRAWMHAEENKRRTLQKSDIATAVSKSDMYDFLIDIVPRDIDLIKASSKSKGPENITEYAFQVNQHEQLQQYHLQQLQQYQQQQQQQQQQDTSQVQGQSMDQRNDIQKS
ncbi:histone-fold-containing protein [Neocallimastix lanati (nom. inval.)]|uniref:Histone-fold-containing protein n=1 Tax=Neocallimastix californiae TaxID=1754190 RepID=A0A1Y2FJ20_9FUNG|nr:histone-fold-containing protein [Neocallimastix sp. JGI-2020a]ORY83933.1 histone-fold-containing protein [Neocallimastix californiae]|eukprot:ORY83933.1 histone-fold-containing protein [Neocallimastix californiae]